MSSCEIFPLISRLSAEGKKFAIVSIIEENKLERTIVAENKVMLGSLDNNLLNLAIKALEEEKTITVNLGNKKIIIEPVEPRPSIIIVGSGIIARYLAKIGLDLGYYIAVVGNGDIVEENFSGVHAISNTIEILNDIITEDSIVIVANEGGKPYDIDALYIAFSKKARFIGLMASQKRAALMISLLLKRGISLEEIKSKFYSPLGLDIGSKTAEEIAMSILSEVVMFIRGGTGKHLKDVKDPYVFLQDAIAGKIEDKCMFVPKVMNSD
ncbi:XdhC family protein [Acidianus sulfidivorans JP7]|uniref:Carbon monoxide dehydrogenase n=1 Tax=Acidianus sulfidivorans JP7 TaxID=619593 RepID=A0A2U9ILK3_9CREN|nr:XdhC family protein [Acidianus sulfidivorans]AWR96902.1 XdhC family protein [Acidianus sulfidivorans JP7]